MSRVLLIDVSSVFFRAFHALPAMNASSGEPTSALYGFSALLLKLLKDNGGGELAFALDAPGPTFRHELYDGYKAQRGPLDPSLKAQLGRLDALVRAFDVPSFRAPGFEADDVLATLARHGAAEGRQVRVVSGDRDLLQVVGPRVDVLFIGQRGRPAAVYDVSAVQARFGVAPKDLPQVVALMGDPSDNLPGVAGVGPKTAAKWVHSFRSIDGILQNVDSLTPAKLRSKVRASADQVRQNEQLARLNSDVPLGNGPWSGPLTESSYVRLNAAFEELEFKSLLPRLDQLRTARSP